MERFFRIVVGIIVLSIIFFLAWQLSSILAYILVAAILSIIGHPLVKLIDKIHLRNKKIPHVVSSLVTLLLIIAVFSGFVGIFVPVIASQANVISSINIDEISRDIEEPVLQLQKFLIDYNILESEESIESLVISNLESFVSVATFSDFFKNALGIAGQIFMAVFAILFITFFFLKEEHLFSNGVLLFVPERYHNETKNILSSSQKMLSRYFVGLMIELSSMVTLLSIGLSVFGVESAFLIGFLGGIMNVIPYLGPIIGTVIGLALGIVTQLGVGEYNELIPMLLIILGTFAGANLIDNIILQPWIYSNSVKAHPLEIFLVILIAGSVAGVLGMMLAIPSYTVIRIIAKEFLTRSRVVQKITENL
ncbi:MAG: AI-2E family transporter [Bacteroidota bacterium]|nr:AI-2E family transporter [Bacteroidota bacterium]